MPTTLRDKAAICGIGQIPFTTNSGMTEIEMLLRASAEAIEDAGLKRGDIDGVIALSANTTAEEYISNLGLKNVRFSSSILRFDALNIISLMHAAMAVATGQARYVLVAQGRNFSSERGTTLGRHEGGVPQMRKAREFNFIYGESTSLIHHALAMREHMDHYGTTERSLAKIVVNQRRHASLNPNALIRKPMTEAQYFKQPYLAEPLRVPDHYIYADGGSAWVVGLASEARNAKKRPVFISGVAMTFPDYAYSYSGLLQDTGESQSARAVRNAYKMAGVTIKDMDFAQLYDSFPMLVILQIPSTGICTAKEVAQWLESTSMAFDGGGLPVNTHGGHIAQGMASGHSHVVEAVLQLRGEATNRQVKNAEIGLVVAVDGAAVVLRR